MKEILYRASKGGNIMEALSVEEIARAAHGVLMNFEESMRSQV